MFSGPEASCHVRRHVCHDAIWKCDAGGLLERDTQIARWTRMIAWLMCVGTIPHPAIEWRIDYRFTAAARVGVATKPCVRPPASKLPTTVPFELMPSARVVVAVGTFKGMNPPVTNTNP